MSRRRKRQASPSVYRCSGCGASVFDSDEPGTARVTLNASDDTPHSCSRANFRRDPNEWQGVPPTVFHATPRTPNAAVASVDAVDITEVERSLIAEMLAEAGFRGWKLPRDASAVVRLLHWIRRPGTTTLKLSITQFT